MRFYLAGTWTERLRCREVSNAIQRATGWTPTATWLDSEEDDGAPEARRVGARRCLNDIERSDVLIAMIGDWKSLGKHVEIGVALALGKPVYLLPASWGADVETSCAFYELCDTSFGSLDDFIQTWEKR